MADKKILVVGPAWVGDMVMAQTLFSALQAKGACTIDVLAPDWSRPLLERMPEVASAIPMPIGHGQVALKTRYQIGHSLRAGNYDEAYVLPNSFKSALVPAFAKIPKRIGWRGEMRYGLLNDVRALDKNRYPFMIQRFTALANPKGEAAPNFQGISKPKLTTRPEDVSAALTNHGLNLDKPCLALCPGAEFGPAKRWPEQYYAEIANEKLDEGWQVWLFGSKKDSEVSEKIQAATHGRCQDLCGKTSLAEAIDLLSAVTAVVTNDSGLMHIAAAVDRPIVVMYGSTDPGFTPPLSDKVRIVSLELECSPCFKRTCPLEHMNCLNDLKPAKVAHALNALLGEMTTLP